MSVTEITLRTQLNSYMEKYEEFQTMLDKSNKIFNTFKKEMDEVRAQWQILNEVQYDFQVFLLLHCRFGFHSTVPCIGSKTWEEVYSWQYN